MIATATGAMAGSPSEVTEPDRDHAIVTLQGQIEQASLRIQRGARDVPRDPPRAHDRSRGFVHDREGIPPVVDHVDPPGHLIDSDADRIVADRQRGEDAQRAAIQDAQAAGLRVQHVDDPALSVDPEMRRAPTHGDRRDRETARAVDDDHPVLFHAHDEDALRRGIHGNTARPATHRDCEEDLSTPAVEGREGAVTLVTSAPAMQPASARPRARDATFIGYAEYPSSAGYGRDGACRDRVSGSVPPAGVARTGATLAPASFRISRCTRRLI